MVDLPQLGEFRETWIFQVLKALAKKFEFSLSTPIEKLEKDKLDIILNGTNEMITVAVEYNKWNVQSYQITFDGIIRMLEEQQERRGDEGMDDMENYRVLKTCRYLRWRPI
jgi:excinuclease ABC subunit A